MSSATNTGLPETPQGPWTRGHDPASSAPFLPHGERDMNKSRVITVGSAAAVLALTAGASSAATTFITSADIKDGAVHQVDLTDKINRDLSAAGSLAGAVYRVENYEN